MPIGNRIIHILVSVNFVNLTLTFSFADPLTNLTISGSNWLQQGNELNLDVKCTGSPPFEYCLNISLTPFNTTGNSTCDNWKPLPTCEFRISRFFFEDKPYTVLIILRNQVTLINKEITIKVYNVKKQSQLSVIVVPVAFTLLAIVFFIFGVAYLVQNNNR